MEPLPILITTQFRRMAFALSLCFVFPKPPSVLLIERLCVHHLLSHTSPFCVYVALYVVPPVERLIPPVMYSPS